jgi:hypothetical protein
MPTIQTRHRRFQEWARSGALEAILRALVQDVKERVDLALTACFMDGTFVIAKGGPGVGKTKRSKGTKVTALTDRSGLPIAISVRGASPHEVTLVGPTWKVHLRVTRTLDRR